nr:zinc finger MYM-type protein 1-like [Coffea arabica]XP_027120906.1 zinc finger MYM-type protein 1-like [Coffea arabica]
MAGEKGKEMKKKAMEWKKLAEDAASRSSGSSSGNFENLISQLQQSKTLLDMKFFELLHFLAGHNDDIKKVVLENAPQNLKLNAPDIQKDISNALASETASIIVNDIGHGLFVILCDESRDASTKEQLAVFIRYMDSHGYVIERFLGILHVRDTTALSLKKAIDVLFSKHGLSISQIRGQGYDGLVTCEGLQKHAQISSMYNTLSTLVHVLEGSSKRQEILREQHLKKVIDDLMTGELLVLMYDSVIDLLLIIENDGLVEQRGQAYALLNSLQSFEFAFILHLIKKIMGITNALSEALQRKDQDIVNAMGLVKVSKQQLQATRKDGWDFLLDEVYLQLQELNNRFNEVNMELLLCMACLNPSDSFAAFDKKKLIRLVEHYPCEFSKLDILALDTELDTYINDLKSAKEFLDLRKISDLAQSYSRKGFFSYEYSEESVTK